MDSENKMNLKRTLWLIVVVWLWFVVEKDPREEVEKFLGDLPFFNLRLRPEVEGWLANLHGPLRLNAASLRCRRRRLEGAGQKIQGLF